MLKILFFARLRDQLGTESTTLAIPDSLTVAEVKSLLIAQNPSWQTPLSASNLLCAINHELVDNTTTIASGDEVAFFPPVTGG